MLERASARNLLGTSFERLTHSPQVHSPFQQQSEYSYRDIRSSTRDIHSSSRDMHSSIRDIYSSIRDVRPPTLYESSLSLCLPNRSKSYHGDLNRIARSVLSGLGACSGDVFRSDRSLLRPSRSVYNIDDRYRNSYTNHTSLSVSAYSKHYNHHNHWSQGPSQSLNSRSRFQKRNAYKAYRSRSANPLIEGRYNSLNSGYHSTISRVPSTRTPASHDLHAHSLTKSLWDIRSSQILIRSRIGSPLCRYSSARTILDDPAYSKSILNPDVYVRWLRSKRDIENVAQRRNQSLYRFNDAIDSTKRRLCDDTYWSRSKNYSSYYGQHYDKPPTFVQQIKGNPKRNAVYNTHGWSIFSKRRLE